MTQLYFKIALVEKRNHTMLEYHCGSDRDEVAKLKSLARGISQTGDPKVIAECVASWHEEIAMLEMKPVS